MVDNIEMKALINQMIIAADRIHKKQISLEERVKALELLASNHVQNSSSPWGDKPSTLGTSFVPEGGGHVAHGEIDVNAVAHESRRESEESQNSFHQKHPGHSYYDGAKAATSGKHYPRRFMWVLSKDFLSWNVNRLTGSSRKYGVGGVSFAVGYQITRRRFSFLNAIISYGIGRILPFILPLFLGIGTLSIFYGGIRMIFFGTFDSAHVDRTKIAQRLLDVMPNLSASALAQGCLMICFSLVVFSSLLATLLVSFHSDMKKSYEASIQEASPDKGLTIYQSLAAMHNEERNFMAFALFLLFSFFIIAAFIFGK